MLKSISNMYFEMLFLLLFISNINFYGVYGAAASSDRPICSYYLSNKVQSPFDSQSKDEIFGPGLILCGNPSDYCFSFWESTDSANNASILDDNSDGSIIPVSTKNIKWLARGCFTNARMCEQESCIAKDKSTSNSYFCCCKGSHCNDNISIKISAEPDDSVNTEPVENINWLDVTYICFYAVAVVIVLIVVGCGVARGIQMRKFKKSQTSTPPEKGSLVSSIDLNTINFLNVVGKGRYGTVYRALFNEEIVAVKLVEDHNKSVFADEKYVYSLPVMDHPNLLSYLGGGELIGPDHKPCLGLVLSYCTKGRLNTFLLENTLDWATFCRIVISCTRGLGHLHSDIRKGDLTKPCIAHRDFNTRNLLLNDDLTCVVSDLGFAIHTQGSKYYQNGEPHSAEMNSLTEVGTLRYMAPEVLEGAVNLRDCETSLKQIDIYALGLVLWEIASRCHDLYQGMPTPQYALPYQAEVGLHPSFEQMQVLVAKNKARPLFPNVWKDTNPAFRQLKETIEDCWDSDAEARLSAMCVETRLMELPELWKRYRSSLGLNSINPSGNISGDGMLIQGKPSGNFVISNELSLPKEKEPPTRSSLFSRHRHQQPVDSSVSEETAETPLPLSPSDERTILTAKNQRQEALRVSPITPLQPHQGVNPCIERNLIQQTKKTSDDLPHVEMNNSNLLDPTEIHLNASATQLLVNEHLVPLLNDYAMPPQHAEPQSPHFTPVVQSPCPYPTVPPIPFLQNEVGNPNYQSKMQNCAWEMERSSYSNTKGWQKWKNNLGGRLASLINRRKARKDPQDEEHQGILVTPVSNNTYIEPPCFSTVSPQGHPHLQSLTDFPRPIDHTIQGPVRENNVQNGPDYLYCRDPPQAPINHHAIPHMMSNNFPQSYVNNYPVGFLTKVDSKDSINKFTDNSSSFGNSESSQEKIKRPTLLYLQADSAPEDSTSDINLKKVKLRDPKKRIKTPCHPLLTRLSLYDDSLMQGNKNLPSLESNLCHSLPLDMDKLDQNSQKDSSYCSSTNSTLESKRSNLKLGSQLHSKENSIGEHSSKSVDIPETQVTKSFKSFTRPILAHV